MSIEQRRKRRITGVVAVVLVFALLTSVLVKIQIIDGKKYKAAGAALSVSQMTVKAARGEILDTNGEALVTNRQGYSVVFKYAEFPSYKKQSERNELIYALINLFEKDGAKWLDRLPVIKKDGAFYIDETKKEELQYLTSENMLDLEKGVNSTADECLDGLIERYGLNKYERSDARDIASVCFGMKYLGFSESNEYTFAEDISSELVSKIKENSSVFKGVDAEAVSYREYDDTLDFTHILGVVGAISSEEYDAEKQKLDEELSNDSLTRLQRTALKTNAYSLDDTYGKSGIEALMEHELRGKNGIKTVTTTSDGTPEESYLIKPSQGNTVVTTVDKGLQKVAYAALEKMLTANRQSQYFECAGAILVQNVKTGELLVCASYPSYDITKYFSDYEKLANDGASPLWNRALQSAYAPGSTMKPAMAIAGLEEGVITKDSTYYCGKYFTIEDITLQCLGYHKYLNIGTALEQSCNVYFYELGIDLGIDKMNKYSSLLGLGQKTGIELPETEGTLASIANREANGGVWNPGDTVQAAIGQSDNLFSPVQLVNYCSIIANGGYRMKPYIIKSVLSSDMSEVISKTEPEVLNKLNLKDDTLDIVRDGMRRVVLNGGCSYYFKDCIVDAAGKTGTSQLKRTTASGVTMDCNNGFFISYAPYDDPEIAIAVVAENVGSGSGISKAAVDVYNYYFSQKTNFEQTGKTGTLIP